LSTSGSGFGGLIYALATNAMIQNLGLEWAFRIIAILSFVVNGAVSLVIRDRNKAVGAIHVAFHFPLLKKSEFWLYMSWGFFSMIGYVITVFSLTDYAQSVGFAPSRGSIVAAVFNCEYSSDRQNLSRVSNPPATVSQGVGRPLIGLSSDKYGRLNIAGLGTLAAGLSCFFIWIFAGKTYAGLIVGT
jgi:hypothetical protein